MGAWLASTDHWALIGAIAGALLAVGALTRAVYRGARRTARTVERLGDDLLGDPTRGVLSLREALEQHIADGHGGGGQPVRRPQGGPWRGPRPTPADIERH